MTEKKLHRILNVWGNRGFDCPSGLRISTHTMYSREERDVLFRYCPCCGEKLEVGKNLQDERREITLNMTDSIGV